MIRRLLAFLGILLVASERQPVRQRSRRDRRVLEPGEPTTQQMTELQGLLSQWLVMWCWYRREYAAIARFGDRPQIIYASGPRQLVFQCRDAELAVPIP